MRKPVTPTSKHRTFGISFPPALKNAARKRAHKLEITVSAYMQRLVEADLARSTAAEKADHPSTPLS